MRHLPRPATIAGIAVALVGAVAPASLAAVNVGDIAVIGYHADDPDALAFVTLAPIGAGEVIRFTDSGWQSSGSFRANEGGIQYTFAAPTPAGTVISRQNPFTSGGWSVNNTGLGPGGYALATAGDQTIAFQGDASSPSFIYALNTGGGGWTDAISSNTTALPPGLVNGLTALDLAAVERDNGYYSGPTTGTKAQLLADISNPANWTTSDTPLAFPAWSFSVTSAGGPAVTSVSVPETDYALNDMTLVTVTLAEAPAPGVPAEIDLFSSAFPYTQLLIENPDTSGSVLVTLSVGGMHTIEAAAFSGATGSAESDPFTVTAPPTPPVVFAGADRTVTISDSTVAVAMVGATVHDVNGLAGVTYEWTPASGPGIVSWSGRVGAATDPSDPAGAIVTISAPGVYHFTLGAIDPELTTDFDDVIITVEPGPPAGEYDAPANYYDPARVGGSWLTGAALHAALQGIIDNHTVRSYDAARFALQITDADPMNPGNILLIYTGASVNAAWDGGSTWNREHQWPQSLNPGGIINSDLHHLRPANPSVNSSRGNKPYGIGGPYFDPNQGAAHRGDSARAIFYMATRYRGQLTVVPGVPGMGQMGNLSDLLNFHYEDPPDTWERRRNHLVYSPIDNPNYFQGNRNPFIDHPELVWSIWGSGPNDSTLFVGAGPDADGASTEHVHFRVIQGAGAPSEIVYLNKAGSAPTTFNATVTGDFAVMNAGPRQAFIAGPGSRPFTITLLDTSTLSSFAGALTIDNTDITSAGPGQGAADADDVVTITADVLAHSNASFDMSFGLDNITVGAAFQADSGLQQIPVNVHNFAPFTNFQAMLDIDSISGLSGPFSLVSPSLPFCCVGLVVPQTLTFQIDTTGLAPGLHAADLTIHVSDEDIPGAAADVLTLRLEVTIAPPTGCPGDADGSGAVDFDDITAVLANWGASYTPGAFGPGDADNDGSVDFDDITAVLANWAGACP